MNVGHTTITSRLKPSQKSHTQNHHNAQHVGGKQPRGHAVETVATLDAEGAYQRKRQLDGPAHHAKAGKQCHPVCDLARHEQLRPQRVQYVQAAAQCQRQCQRSPGDRVDGTQACALEGVVGGTLVRGEWNRAGEAGGHRIAVGLHMPGVAVQQPQSHDQAGAECEQEQEAEGIRGVHLGSVGDAGSGQEL
jgi:hypothetical protein